MFITKKTTQQGTTYKLVNAEIKAGEGEVFRFEDRDITRNHKMVVSLFDIYPSEEKGLEWETTEGLFVIRGKVSESYYKTIYIVPEYVKI